MVVWGNNWGGQTNVPAGLTDVATVSGGDGHSLALKSDGTVVAWGWNGYGQTDVPAALTDVVDIAAGAFHSLGLKSDGTVVGWGDNCDATSWWWQARHRIPLHGKGTRSVSPPGFEPGTPSISGMNWGSGGS